MKHILKSFNKNYVEQNLEITYYNTTLVEEFKLRVQENDIVYFARGVPYVINYILNEDLMTLSEKLKSRMRSLLSTNYVVRVFNTVEFLRSPSPPPPYPPKPDVIVANVEFEPLLPLEPGPVPGPPPPPIDIG